MPVPSIIEQTPLGIFIPVGQDLIFVVSNQTAVLNETRVKFVAEVYIGTSVAAVNPTANTPIGTFKTTPNNAGVGMFDLRNVIENYVKADNMAAKGSKYKTTVTSGSVRHPIHLIDQYSLNTNLGRYMRVRFSVEYLVGTTVEIDINTQANTAIPFFIFNGYVKHTDVLNKSGNNFGYNADKFILADDTKEFLTNAPTTQYANLEDYGTLSMVSSNTDLYAIFIEYFNSAGNSIGSESINRNVVTGAWSNPLTANSQKQILHFGCFPGNLQNWGSSFASYVAAGAIQGGSLHNCSTKTKQG
jgi:hypothetical protein